MRVLVRDIKKGRTPLEGIDWDNMVNLGLVMELNSLPEDKYIVVDKDYPIIPKWWENRIWRRRKDGKACRRDILYHGPKHRLETFAPPQEIFFSEMKKAKNPVALYYWKTGDVQKAFRFFDLFEGYRIFLENKENINVKRTISGFVATVPSSTNVNKRYSVRVQHLYEPWATDVICGVDENIRDWSFYRRDGDGRYTFDFMHEKRAFCGHAIASYFKLMANEDMVKKEKPIVPLFPRPTEYGMESFKKSDRVLRHTSSGGDSPTLEIEKDIILQENALAIAEGILYKPPMLTFDFKNTR